MGAGVTRWYRSYLEHDEMWKYRFGQGRQPKLDLAGEFHRRVQVWWRLQHPVTHELKSWPFFFEPLVQGDKTFEIRHNDRGFVVGDLLWVREHMPRSILDRVSGEVLQRAGYTGREVWLAVSYTSDHAQKPDYVVLAVKPAYQGMRWRDYRRWEVETYGQ